MASALMLDDRLQIDGFNPAVLVGSFGTLKDGFPKNMGPDGTYTTQIVDQQTVYTDPLPLDANDPALNIAGPMYLKTAQTSPAPFRGFPARKLEYSDGTVTWVRPGTPWPWVGSHGENDGYTYKLIKNQKNQTMIFWLVLIALIIFLFSKMKLS